MVANSKNYDGNLALNNQSDYINEMNRRPEYRGQNENQKNNSSNGLSNSLYGANSGDVADKYLKGFLSDRDKTNNKEDDQENNKQSQNTNSEQDQEETDMGKIQKARLLNRILNKSKVKIPEMSEAAKSMGKGFSFGAYRLTGDPAIVGKTLGLSMLLWWPLHFVGKYIGSFKMFSKFVPLSKPDAMNLAEIVANKEKSSIMSFIAFGVDLVLWGLIFCIIVVIIALILRAGDVTIWTLVTDPVRFLSGLKFISDIIKDIL